MESTNNNNNNQMFVCELKELRNEISAMKKRVDILEKSHLKQQERINILEIENHTLKMKKGLNNSNDNEEGGSVLKRKRTENNEEIGSKTPASASASTCDKKTKTNNNNNNDDEEAVLLPRYDNGDSFDSLSDDLLHKIVEFDGHCYSKFGSINKRCRNIYEVKEYKLKKETCVFGYGTLDMILQRYLQKRKEVTLDYRARVIIVRAVIWYNRLDAIDWIIQLEDSELLECLCCVAAYYGRIDILTRVFSKSNLTMIDGLLNYIGLCYNAAFNGKLETLKWLRNHCAEWNATTFAFARDEGHDEIVHYLRNEGCPEQDEDGDESLGSQQFGSDGEDGDY